MCSASERYLRKLNFYRGSVGEFGFTFFISTLYHSLCGMPMQYDMWVIRRKMIVSRFMKNVLPDCKLNLIFHTIFPV